jgi:hypothetical protein
VGRVSISQSTWAAINSIGVVIDKVAVISASSGNHQIT